MAGIQGPGHSRLSGLSRAIARQLATGIRADYANVLPSALACFEDDFRVLHRAPAAAGHAPPLRCTTNIQNAITACQAGQVVQLGAGTLHHCGGQPPPGAGAGQTILQRTNGATLGSYVPGSNPSPIIIVGTQRFNNSPSAPEPR